MRLTDEQIKKVFWETWKDRLGNDEWDEMVTQTVRKCLALAALPDEQKPYEDVERRGFSVSQPGELPR